MMTREQWNQLLKRNKYNDLAYEFWKACLPKNLQKETPNYNLYGAYKGGLQPRLEADGKYHLGSRNPQTGEILKRKGHDTYKLAIDNEIAAGYFPYEKNGVTYTKTYAPIGDISGYKNGTDGVQANLSFDNNFANSVTAQNIDRQNAAIKEWSDLQIKRTAGVIAQSAKNAQLKHKTIARKPGQYPLRYTKTASSVATNGKALNYQPVPSAGKYGMAPEQQRSHFKFSDRPDANNIVNYLIGMHTKYENYPKRALTPTGQFRVWVDNDKVKNLGNGIVLQTPTYKTDANGKLVLDRNGKKILIGYNNVYDKNFISDNTANQLLEGGSVSLNDMYRIYKNDLFARGNDIYNSLQRFTNKPDTIPSARLAALLDFGYQANLYRRRPVIKDQIEQMKSKRTQKHDNLFGAFAFGDYRFPLKLATAMPGDSMRGVWRKNLIQNNPTIQKQIDAGTDAYGALEQQKIKVGRKK